MRALLVIIVMMMGVGCASLGEQAYVQATDTQCVGKIELPAAIADKLEAVEDERLLQAAMGQPQKGGLCQGQVYKAKDDITLYRAWNSTNRGSEMGNWWAVNMPQGKIAQYRADYEICYQWSPLDMLTHCTLEAGATVVIGTGQSAYCSEYLTYPASVEIQVYIEAATEVMDACATYEGVFSWRPQ